jgi:ligand-binding sensor domain-containing protein
MDAKGSSGSGGVGKVLVSLAAFLVASVSPCVAANSQPETDTLQLPLTDDASLRFQQLPFGDGPSHDRVIQIVQDDLGFLWLGTQDGIKRYDGYRFREFRHEPANPNSLGGGYVYALFKDRSGKLWIGCDQTFDRYDPATEVFTHDQSPPALFKGPVSHFSQDRQGMLWLATNHGLNRLEPGSWKVTCYRHTPGDSSSLSSDLIRAAFEQRDGTFWVATAAGLDIFDRQTGKVTSHIPLPQPPSMSVTVAGPLMSLFEDHAGVLWVTYSFENGLARVDRQAGKLIRYTYQGAGSSNSLFTGIESICERRAWPTLAGHQYQRNPEARCQPETFFSLSRSVQRFRKRKRGAGPFRGRRPGRQPMGGHTGKRLVPVFDQACSVSRLPSRTRQSKQPGFESGIRRIPGQERFSLGSE